MEKERFCHCHRPSCLPLRHQRLAPMPPPFLALTDHMPGVTNAIADDLSRLWHLTNSQSLVHLNSLYPQKQPWRIVHLRPEVLASVTTALRALRPQLQLCLNDPKTKTVIGTSGLTSAAPLACPRTHHPSRTSCLFSRCLPCDCDRENLHPAKNLSNLSEWRTSCAQLERRWPTWGPGTLVSTPMASNLKHSPTFSVHVARKTHHRTG